ncbi:MAG: T9SS type A sorting domain-containing protein, partial [Saprospiraceae bacterium]|nr:T9SS type A sorting domain-containing protein [Saprospiraceae bacterium]
FRTALNNTMSRFLVHIPPYDLPSSECVWPGDADNNGVVNHFDLLYLGLAMGKQGGGRAELASAWKGSDAADWPEQSPLYHINFKNMDADGNGFVEPADTSIVVMQWGRMIHPYKSDPYAMPGPPDKYNQELSVRILPDTFSSGQAVEIPVILGSTDAQAADFLGLAFSVSCDPDRIVSDMRFEPTGSWMGAPGQDLICIQRSFPGQRRLDIALSRIDGAGVSGAGQIGKLLLTFKPVFSDSITNTPVFISHAMALTAGEDRIGLGSSRTNIFIEKNQSVSATAPSWYGQDIRLSPNPATSVLRIFSLQAAIRRVEISTVTGTPQIIFEPEYPVNVAEIRLENVPAGTCIARIFTENGVVSKKFVIAR